MFSVMGYFPSISEELKNRGWVEKRDPYHSPINFSHYFNSTRNYIHTYIHVLYTFPSRLWNSYLNENCLLLKRTWSSG